MLNKTYSAVLPMYWLMSIFRERGMCPLCTCKLLIQCATLAEQTTGCVLFFSAKIAVIVTLSTWSLMVNMCRCTCCWRTVFTAVCMSEVCVWCCSALPLHIFTKDFIRKVYLGQVIYSIEANISQATKSAFVCLVLSWCHQRQRCLHLAHQAWCQTHVSSLCIQ